MITDKSHTAEDEYFRNQEAERGRDQAWDSAKAERAKQAKREESQARRFRQAARAADIGPGRAAAVRGLNRLIVGGWNETASFDEALSIIRDPVQRQCLRDKRERRRVFREDLSRAVVIWGGVPATGASFGARGLACGRSLRRLAAGLHGGDAYAACARAAEHASRQYAAVLRLTLPLDVRFGIEQQHAEVDRDGAELRRCRWGAQPVRAA